MRVIFLIFQEGFGLIELALFVGALLRDVAELIGGLAGHGAFDLRGFAPKLFGFIEFTLLPKLRGLLRESLLVAGVTALGL